VSAPIALQLYTIREDLAKDFAAGVRKVAAMGYRGVETAGFPGTTPQAAAQLFKELGLEVPAAHVPLPVAERRQEVFDSVAPLGCKRIISSPSRDHVQTLDHVKRACETFNEISAAAAAQGLTFGLHNHDHEFRLVEGRYPHQVMLELLDPKIFFEIDTYWVLHIKDGPAVRGQPMVAVGEGVMDFQPIVKAGEGSTEWMIVELDECATNMLTAVEKSYRFLVENKLADGKNGKKS
jgi:sugar phosphate isomerase/epimerase